MPLSGAVAQVSAPVSSNAFLELSADARGSALAGTMTASPDEAAAAFYNPAVLGSLKKDYSLTFTHGEYQAGLLHYSFLGFSSRIDETKGFSAALVRLGVDDIADTRNLIDGNGIPDYDNIQFFSAADYAFFLSYGQKIEEFKDLQLGAALKVVHRRAGDFATAWGLGFDIGVALKAGGYDLGIHLSDATGSYNNWFYNEALLGPSYVATGNDVPYNALEVNLPVLRLGASRRWPVLDGESGIRAMADVDIHFDGARNTLIRTAVFSVNPRAAIEADYHELLFVRAGIGDYQRTASFDGQRANMAFNLGSGVQYEQFRLDYAYLNVVKSSPGLFSHVVSLNVGLNKK